MEFKSLLHPHKLKFMETLKRERCFGCFDAVDGPSYVCETCSYFVLHKSCCELPPQIQRQALHPHPLRYNFVDQIELCDECETLLEGKFYNCMQCAFKLDYKCASTLVNDDEQDHIHKDRKRKGISIKATINHFSHPHQLTRCHGKPTPWRRIAICVACKQSLYGTLIYTCLPCAFLIHESCIDNMPKQVQSLFHHPNHVLHPRLLYQDRRISCDACQERVYDISFSCRKCDFDLHVSCATYITRTIKHNFHRHHLLQMGVSIVRGKSCDVCHGDCGDSSFGCIKCNYYIHLECAQVPRKVQHRYHRHPLVLTTPFVEDDSGQYYCDICETDRNPEHHVFRCEEECNFIAHIDCVINPKIELPEVKFWDHQPTEENSNTDEKFDIDDENSRRAEIEYKMDNIQLIHDVKIHPHPLTLDDSKTPFVCDRCGELWFGNSTYRCNTCLFYLDIKCATLNYELINGDETKEVREIKTTIYHFSHPHMLTCCKVNIATVDQRFGVSCNACRQRLYGKVYTCTTCGPYSFILHESCLKDMPMQFESPFHPRHLLLPWPMPTRLMTQLACHICWYGIEGIGFSCTECQYYAHISCAKYTTREFKHKSHVHILQHLGKSIFVQHSPNCSACAAACSDTLFGCLKFTCRFFIHLECLRLPSLVKHMRHLHPLPLTKSVIEDDSGEYFCDICETERNPEHEVYCCEECNFTAHIDCVISEVEPPEQIFEYLLPRLVKQTI